jgi:hypothetical protein
MMKTKSKKTDLKSWTKSTNAEGVYSESDPKAAWATWFRKRIDETGTGNWLFVTVNISNEKLRLASEFGNREFLTKHQPTNNDTAWIAEWSGIWNKFFLKLGKFETKGKALPVDWFAVFENETKKLNPKYCPTHSHLLVAVPARESLDSFVRRFCSAFNHYVYPLKVSLGSEWVWDVKRAANDGKSLVLNVKTLRDDGVVDYVTKQIREWGYSERILLGSYKEKLNENKTDEGK